ncbi:MAG: hypothetical protein KA978_19490 [Deltaproteobacteria bacterium]|jgi:hypothetical protein|nr:hypothetical protein [Deltaproteobacteria bacterium]
MEALMTRDEARAELFSMPSNQPERATEFYRRALRAGVAWVGLEQSLAALQDASSEMQVALIRIWREEGSPA